MVEEALASQMRQRREMTKASQRAMADYRRGGAVSYLTISSESLPAPAAPPRLPSDQLPPLIAYVQSFFLRIISLRIGVCLWYTGGDGAVAARQRADGCSGASEPPLHDVPGCADPAGRLPHTARLQKIERGCYYNNSCCCCNR